ncbi:MULTISPECIES: acyltransferase family protein [unclassified Rathayibacter]|uniref:acyltransferase family protein n=1 Tax=unclassified Rathayibacter TaxID=2609250 RepID=UPI0006F730F7|nr:MULTISPECIES: acyltransferase [unclassified Rathayibacter]KQQ05906.1 hypothetical protein ASF42_05040 [Rathayibacter sp. Leaf294]KQS13763.1 hypothetical protein ASG06_05050 [Rathayibacter sp. Leaf185]
MRAERDQTIDIARGLAITAIVAGHVLRGLASSQIIDSFSTSAQLADRLLYSVHLAVFAFLTGLFIRQSVEKAGVSAYVRARVIQFLYLYVVWQILQSLVKVVTSSFVNSPKALVEVLWFWYPEGQLWYLPLLTVVLPFIAIVGPWRSGVRAGLAVGVSLVVGLASWGLNGPVAGTQGYGILPFFVVGALVGAGAFAAWAGRVRATWVVLALVVGGGIYVAGNVWGGTPPTTGGEVRTGGSVAVGVVATCAGIVFVLAVAWLIARYASPVAAFASLLGRRSLEIFLGHILFASGSRIVLDALGVTSVAVYIVVGVAVGIAGPVVLIRVLDKMRFPWLFAAPSRWVGTKAGRRS